MIAFAIRTVPKRMRGTFRAQVHPKQGECFVVFSVPPSILGLIFQGYIYEC